MKFFIRNDDGVASILLVAIPKADDNKFAMLNAEKKASRKVLRPGEELVLNIEEGYFLGIEEL